LEWMTDCAASDKAWNAVFIAKRSRSNSLWS